MSLSKKLSQQWLAIQGSLFGWLEVELGKLSERERQLVATLELVKLEGLIPSAGDRSVGRPEQSRRALARAFVAKAIYNLETTRQLLDRLGRDATMRRICGWEPGSKLPSEATFSRAFAEFAESQLAERVHAKLIETYQAARVVGHISRDSTAIEARERGVKKKKKEKPTAEEKAKEKAEKKTERARRKQQGEGPTPKEQTRLERQPSLSLAEMQADLPRDCDWGTKRNSQGRASSWLGYKFHLDVADGGIPIGAMLTSASVHDSQVAIPLATQTAQRVTSLYDLMDKGYDAEPIRQHSRSLGHVPIIDHQGRAGKVTIEFAPHEAQRYKERTTVERIYARLKDEFGGRGIRVRGATKVMASLMFGLLCITADQLMRLVR